MTTSTQPAGHTDSHPTQPNKPVQLRRASRLCAAKTRAGGLCKHEEGWGTDHAGFGRCKMHGGSSPGGRVQGARLREQAERLLMLEWEPSLRVIQELRDGGDVLPRDRIRAAAFLAEQAKSLVEGSGGELVLRIKWPE